MSKRISDLLDRDCLYFTVFNVNVGAALSVLSGYGGAEVRGIKRFTEEKLGLQWALEVDVSEMRSDQDIENLTGMLHAAGARRAEFNAADFYAIDADRIVPALDSEYQALKNKSVRVCLSSHCGVSPLENP